MIKLVSRPTQEALERLSQLEQRRQAAIVAGEEIPKVVAACYRDGVVKRSIASETAGKCAYCESKVEHVHWGDVEHILPKSKYPERMLDYANLTFACSICNNNKLDYDAPDLPLLNPYSDDPEEFLVAVGPLIWHRPGKARGELSVTLLDLNRVDLVKRREQRLDHVAKLADKRATSTSEPLRRALTAELLRTAVDAAEFACVIRRYLANVGIERSDTTQAQ